MGAGLALVAKKRKSATTVEAINVVGEVDGCDVLLVDDITETAGTLTAAAKILREHGARSIRAAVSHCILNDVALERLKIGADRRAHHHQLHADRHPRAADHGAQHRDAARPGDRAHQQQRERDEPVSDQGLLRLGWAARARSRRTGAVRGAPGPPSLERSRLRRGTFDVNVGSLSFPHEIQAILPLHRPALRSPFAAGRHVCRPRKPRRAHQAARTCGLIPRR